MYNEREQSSLEMTFKSRPSNRCSPSHGECVNFFGNSPSKDSMNIFQIDTIDEDNQRRRNNRYEIIKHRSNSSNQNT